MRSYKLLSTLAVVGFSAAGIAAPAYAAVEDAIGRVSPASLAGGHATSGQDGTRGMDRMHEQMMQKFPEMANMDMMRGEPGMVRMHEAMVAGRQHDGDASQRGEGEER